MSLQRRFALDLVGTTPARYAASMSRLTAIVRREGALYVAQCVEVDVASQGESIESALENLREALELHFEDSPDALRALPAAIIATVEVGAA